MKFCLRKNYTYNRFLCDLLSRVLEIRPFYFIPSSFAITITAAYAAPGPPIE